MKIKLNGWDIRHIREFKAACASNQRRNTLRLDQWVGGRGVHTRRRNPPPYVIKWDLRSPNPPKYTKLWQDIVDFKSDYPRCRYCLVFDEARFYDDALAALNGFDYTLTEQEVTRFNIYTR